MVQNKPFNKSNSPFRFHEKVIKEGKVDASFKGNSAWDRLKVKEKICPLCNKKYEFSISYSIGEKWCRHDEVMIRDTTLTQGEKDRIERKLKPNEFAVKDKNGMIHICERTP